jgi:hypothetical protein
MVSNKHVRDCKNHNKEPLAVEKNPTNVYINIALTNRINYKCCHNNCNTQGLQYTINNS